MACLGVTRALLQDGFGVDDCPFWLEALAVCVCLALLQDDLLGRRLPLTRALCGRRTLGGMTARLTDTRTRIWPTRASCATAWVSARKAFLSLARLRFFAHTPVPPWRSHPCTHPCSPVTMQGVLIIGHTHSHHSIGHTHSCALRPSQSLAPGHSGLL